MKYKIDLLRFGTLMDSFVVSARERRIVGNYHDGKLYGPDESQVLLGLRYQYRKAFKRSTGFWCTHMSDIQRCDMNRKKDGAAMGTLIAKFIPEPLVKP